MTREQYDAKIKVVYDKWSKCGVDNENLLMLWEKVKDEYIASLESELESLLKAQEEEK